MALRVLIVLLILAVPMELPGCGPFLPVAWFHLQNTPDAPVEYSRGQLGIPQPEYGRRYLVIAYRYLSGVPLNDAEQKAVLPPPPEPVTDKPVPTVTPNPWLEARNRVPGIKPLTEINPYRESSAAGFFSEYLNCNDDAFRTAAATLDRVRRTPAMVADWIAAQDTVFDDCAKGDAIPQPSNSPQLRADRAYQVASAKFYTGHYDDARKDFQTIAADASSPWHGIAPYIAARCLIRDGKLAPAETELQHIASDPAQAKWHSAAQGLLGYVRIHLHPPERMHELALALVKPGSPTIGQDLIDYRNLWDQEVKPSQDDDLTAWIGSFQAGGNGAIEKWRALHTLPWLVAALEHANTNDPNLSELLTAAAAVKPDSPGYLMVSDFRMRLLPPEEGRALGDKLLAGNLPMASSNEIRAERMRLAANFDEFLKFAPRHPVAELTYELTPLDGKEVDLDDDATGVFNHELPVSYLKRAQASPLLPDHVRKELERVIFVRTLLLSDAPPFDQIFTLLHSPGMQLDMESGFGRVTKEVDKIDDYRDNWWCGERETEVNHPPEAPFLSDAERKQAADEATKMHAAGAAPDWIGAQTLTFAQAHPQDPRVPEALYLVVRSTRYGCTDAKTGDISKRAFDLLHRRYPTSEWTKKTPYWYNGDQ